ncbi:MAG: hypothetical protein AAGE99_03015 [Chlamydiota bacterium]
MELISSEQMFVTTAILGSPCPFLQKMDEEEKVAQKVDDMEQVIQLARNTNFGASIVFGLSVVIILGIVRLTPCWRSDHFKNFLVVVMCSFIIFAHIVGVLMPSSIEAHDLVTKGCGKLNAQRYLRLKNKVRIINRQLVDNSLKPEDKNQLDLARRFFSSRAEKLEKNSIRSSIMLWPRR